MRRRTGGPVAGTLRSLAPPEARRTFPSLDLYGSRVDAVIADRVLPAEGADPRRSRWVGARAGARRRAP